MKYKIVRDEMSPQRFLFSIRRNPDNCGLIPNVEGAGGITLRIATLNGNGGYSLHIMAAPDELTDDNYMMFRNFAEEAKITFKTMTSCEFSTGETLMKVLSWAFEHGDKFYVEWPEGVQNGPGKECNCHQNDIKAHHRREDPAISLEETVSFR